MVNIGQRWLRALGQRAVGLGLALPELALARLSEYSHLRQTLREGRINCIIDVGANRGQFGSLARRLGYQGLIHSFEPMAEAYQRLQRRVAADSNWECHPIALGENAGRQRLRVNTQHPQMTSLLAINQEYGSVEPVEVDVVTLDSIYDELTSQLDAPRTFLKIDTEGHDLSIFRGARGVLASINAVLIEVFVQPIYPDAPHFLEVLSALEQAGYELDHLTPVSRTHQGKLMCLNALMTRREQ